MQPPQKVTSENLAPNENACTNAAPGNKSKKPKQTQDRQTPVQFCFLAWQGFLMSSPLDDDYKHMCMGSVLLAAYVKDPLAVKN